MRILLLILTFISLQASGQALFHAHNKVSAPAVDPTDTAFVKPLDTYTATVAYSLRKLRSAYSGDAVRVRRSSDNTETDIGFTPNGNFDATAYAAFIGAGQGYAVTWYDQSGNGVNATNATSTEQPEVRLSIMNGKPILHFRKVNHQYFDISTTLLGGTTPEIYTAHAHMGGSWAPLAYGNLVNYWIINPTDKLYVQGGSGTANPYSADGQVHILNMWMESGVKKATYQDISYSFTEGATAIPSGTQSFRINSVPSQTGWDYEGWMTDYIIFSSDQGSAARTFIANNIKSYYNIP